ncbi:MAG: hypothetical protein HQM10_24420 [Candidatus Riflebacteria bacterium]|nr:hypothetical protein [Candidatus Riflebacteria bacterium]
MKKLLGILCFLALSTGQLWAVTAEEIVKHFEENQKWVQCSMISYHVQKKASDERIADLYDFVSEKTYDYEGLVINGADYSKKEGGELSELLSKIGNGVLAVVQKQATDDNKNLFKPTWLGYHTPDDKRVSNWFCLIMGNQIKTYLTRVDPKSKLDEMGTDPLVLNVLNKNLFNYELVKDLGDQAVLRITPKANASTNIKEGIVELARIKVGAAETWYAKKISGTLNTGARGTTTFGNFRVAIAPVGKYIAYSNDNSLKSDVKIMDISQAMNEKASQNEKIYVFGTQIHNVSYQSSKDIKDYEVDFLTTVKHLHINPPINMVADYLNKGRLGTLTKVTAKIVRNH